MKSNYNNIYAILSHNKQKPLEQQMRL